MSAPWHRTGPDKKSYLEVPGEIETKMPNPMPISMMVWSGPGSDASAITVASAYELATHHRKPPPAFGPVSKKAPIPAPTASASR